TGYGTANERTHKYHVGEKVNLWSNKVGPYHNPQETYSYYKLPFCKPNLGVGFKRKKQGIGETIAGDELRNSGLVVQFAEAQPRTIMCTSQLTDEAVKQFTQAVDESYWYNMYLDDLPIWGMVGRQGNVGDGSEPVLYGHRRFDVAYNGDRIIEVNLTSENPQPISKGQTIELSYEVLWKETDIPFEKRFDRYLDYDFFEHQIHWFSIFNSFMMVVFLCGLVALILLRTLRNDFAKYTEDDEELEGIGRALADDSGWKQVHGDVFRAPQWLVLFSALYGTGWQMIVLVQMVVLFAVAGPLHGDVYEQRGELVISFIVCYALTAVVGGYTSASYYRQYFSTPRAEQHSQWQKAMLLSALLLPCIAGGVLFALNGVAVYYDTTNTIPVLIIIKVIAIWAFVAFPLSIVGCMLGRHIGGKSNFPCRVNSIPREIPPSPWFSNPMLIVPVAGVLPFGSIFIEMYFIFTSFWNYKYYYVYGFVALVYVLLATVIVCTTIVATYFVLNAENYHWQWISFGSAASTAGYVFLYSVYYFLCKTEMFGALQFSFYFGYMGLFCLSLALLCGAIGLIGSTIFVKHIYRHIKID
ncbi:unnamed protein product, partial [Chrysoparadoxa australica]